MRLMDAVSPDLQSLICVPSRLHIHRHPNPQLERGVAEVMKQLRLHPPREVTLPEAAGV